MVPFGPLGDLPATATVQARINTAFDNLFHHDKDGRRHAVVCTFCDEYILSRHDRNFFPIKMVRKSRHLFEWTKYIKDPSELRALEPLIAAYTFHDIDNRIEPKTWLQGLCLSPRGIIGRSTEKLRFGFSCCGKCNGWLRKEKLPFYSIVNSNYVGHAPDCLTSLSEVELAFISPVKGYGYCFSWVGGSQKCLKGNLTFMRVEERSIVNAAAQLHGMGLTNHIVILLNGKMTRGQKMRANQEIRVAKVLSAVKWLCKNHRRWKDIDYNTYQTRLENFLPTIIDHSEEVASQNQNVEQEELFSCYYPDGTMNNQQGGLNNPEDFKRFIDDMHQAGFKIELQVELGKKFLNGSDGDQNVIICSKQIEGVEGG